MITNLELALPEIFLSVAVMFNLILGVYKKNSSNLVYNLSLFTIIVTIALILNLLNINKILIFNNSYIIDNLSSFIKILVLIFAFFGEKSGYLPPRDPDPTSNSHISALAQMLH